MGATDTIQSVTRTRQVTAAEMRSLTGFNASRDIPDPDVEAAIDRAQAAVVGQLTSYAAGLPLVGTRDGSNTRFMVPEADANRVILDATLDLAVDGDDVQVWLYENPDTSGIPTYTAATVSSVDGLHGIVTLASAPASTIDRVLLDARLTAARIDLDRLKNAIAYYAAHLLVQSAVRSGKVNLADAEGSEKNRTPRAPAPKWMDLFLHEMRYLRSPAPAAALKPTSLVDRDPIVEGWRHAP